MVNRRHVLVGGGAAVLGLGAYLRARSPGKPAGLVDSSGITIEGSIPKRVFVDINAIRQGMIIQSRDISLPVLLFCMAARGCRSFFTHHTSDSS